MPTLIRTLHDQGVKTVVFHCALSQQRGPTAAGMFVREKERLVGKEGEEAGEENGQEVFVLEGGFVKWQEK